MGDPTVHVTAVFASVDVLGAMLYWEDTFWADLQVGPCLAPI